MSRSLFMILVALVVSVPLQAALTVEPITWNVIGLDSNDPATGPNQFPVGARVCSDVATTNVSVELVWDSANPFIDARPGSLTTIVLPSISAGGCADAYFEVEVDRDPAAFDTTRLYHIEATDGSGTYSTPTPRELYVEHLISQNRNSITDVLYGPVGGPLTSVAPGSGMTLAVGQTYDIQLQGGTATQGYEQFEAFINFTNTIFRILEVETTYSADSSPNVSNPHPQLYADACTWENDPNSPNYRSCLGEGKAGGANVVTTYTIEIIGGGGTSQALNTLLYDFSGSSYHYNADFGTGARIANIVDPTQATMSKSFAPNPVSVNGTSVLTIAIGNPNAGEVSGYNFVDNLPAGLVIAATPNATTSGCGTPTLTAPAGGTSISFSNGTVAANGSCVIRVDVTSAAANTYNNTTNNLFVGTTDTGVNASASLVVTNETPATPLCAQPLASWTFPAGFNTSTPAPSSGTGSAAAGAGVNPTSSTNSTTTADGTESWASNGSITTGAVLVTANDEYFEFAVDTTGLSEVELTFDALRKTPNGPQGVAVFVGTTDTRPEAGTSVFNNATALPTQNTWVTFGPITVNSGLNPAGTTFFRIYTFNSGNTNAGSDFNLDNVTFTGCSEPADPTIMKAFSPDPIAVGGVSTLTFTLTNTNAAALTGTTFSDTFPAGIEVAATPNASTTCGGTWAPAAGATTVTLTGGTIPASSSCTVSVDVTATAGGVHNNVSGIVTTTEGGTGDDTPATDTLTAVLPPSIAKAFAPSPILANGVSTLTFTITNPNPDLAISGVAFSDTFPVAPGAMVVAPVPNATVSAGCGAATFSPSAGAGSVAFSNGSIAAGGTCVVTVDVTAPAVGTYNNTTGPVSHVVNAQTINGNTASDSLDVNPPNPAISLLKEVGPTATGPWSAFLPVAVGDSVHFQFTIENTGDVPLTNVSITDDTLDVSACNAALSGVTLEVPDALDDNHLFTCVAGPVLATAGSHTNVASAQGQFGVTPVTSADSDATYATTALTLDKTAAETSFTNAGDSLNYSYLVTNNGFAPLQGPVTVTDDKATVSCPNVSTVGDLDNFFDPGESITCTATYVITAADVTAGFVTNTATATVEGVSSNSDSVTVPSSTSANLALTKTLTTAGPFSAGQSVSFTIAVTNNGPATATNVQVTDVPTNLTITNVSGGGCAALPCTIPSIAMGVTVNITVTATIVANGAFGNSATADGDQPDPDPTDNTDDDGDTAGPAADVALVKTLTTAGPYSAGQSVTFTIDVTNNGPSTATGVDVTDTPTNLTVTNVSGGGCAALPCTIPSINSGVTVSITVTATINASGAFENSATATPDEPDPTPANNTDEDGDTTGGGSADVSVVKTLTSVGPFTAGDTVSFTITVANAGPATATNIQVTDTPSNLTITGVSGSGCAAMPCTIPSLSTGTSTDIFVTATIDGPGAFLNTTTVTATEPDPDPTDNDDDDGDTASSSANLSLVKTLTTAGPHFAGDSVTFTILITNAGPSDATSVQVTDTPTNFAITNVSGSGCTAFPCTIPIIPAGTDTTITVTGTITAPGAFENTATAVGAEPDPDPTDNTDEDGSATGPTADVSLVKDLITAGPFTIGDSIDYTITVSNAGPATATNINVTDVPSNLTITSVTGSGCGAFPCTIANLAAGDGTVIHVTATINAGGTFNNTATATPAEPDPDPTDNTDEDGDVASPAADLSLTKTLTSAGPYSAGGSVSFDIVIFNGGPSTATNVQVTDTPSNFNITAVSGSGCAALPCTIPSLASGASTTITVTGTVVAAGAFGNSATVTGDQEDPDPTNNTDEDGSITAASADVSVVKTLDTPGPFAVGQSITYLITVSNAGPSAATNVLVTDVPANLVIDSVSGAGCTAFPCTIPTIGIGENAILTVSATITGAGAFSNTATVDATEPDPDPTDNEDEDGDTASGSADLAVQKILTTPAPHAAGDVVQFTIVVTNNGPSSATNVIVTDTPVNVTITSVAGACVAIPCNIPSLASGDSATIEVTGTITASGDFSNSTTVDGDEPDPNPTDNTDEDGSTTGAAADVSVVKTLITAGPYSAGQTVTFTITVANAGPSTATNVQVTDTPSNLTITSVSGSGCAALPCTIASISAGSNTVINVGATITAVGPFTNSATATADEPDPDPTNNTGSDGDTAGGTSVDLEITKTASDMTLTVGQTFDFTLVVRNNGPGTATNVVVTDTLPAQFALQTASSTQGTCSGTTIVTCNIGTMLNAATVTITLTGSATGPGPLVNTATVSSNETETDTANNTSSTTPTVAAAEIPGIPTASEWGLLMLALSLAAVAVLRMRLS